jgi:hypothetical protein
MAGRGSGGRGSGADCWVSLPHAAVFSHQHDSLFPLPASRRARSFELSEHITGAITFSGVSREAPILLVKLAVVRIEYADEEVLDTVSLSVCVPTQ